MNDGRTHLGITKTTIRILEGQQNNGQGQRRADTSGILNLNSIDKMWKTFPTSAVVLVRI